MMWEAQRNIYFYLVLFYFQIQMYFYKVISIFFKLNFVANVIFVIQYLSFP